MVLKAIFCLSLEHIHLEREDMGLYFRRVLLCLQHDQSHQSEGNSYT